MGNEGTAVYPRRVIKVHVGVSVSFVVEHGCPLLNDILFSKLKRERQERAGHSCKGKAKSFSC